MIQKLIFKDEVKKILLDLILTGEVKPGQRISLPAIAKKLEVSVTPIREALTQLSEIGIVSYIANRGFFLTELSAQEAKEVYELMAILEVYAIEHSAFNKTLLKELRVINDAFKKALRPIEMLDFDRQFHQKLISTYKNTSAHSIIENLRVRVSLYDYAFWNEDQKMESIAMHERIIKYLNSNDIKSAVKVLRQNWTDSIDDILFKLKENLSN